MVDRRRARLFHCVGYVMPSGFGHAELFHQARARISLAREKQWGTVE
jgi:hypothetical protein